MPLTPYWQKRGIFHIFSTDEGSLAFANTRALAVKFLKRQVNQKKELLEIGFTKYENIYSEMDIELILNTINQSSFNGGNFRKSEDLFAVRQFFKEIPKVKSLILSEKLKFLINDLLGPDYFIVKSIYFDKPESSNWFVSYHQDLTISVDKKVELDTFGPWTIKQNQFAVQPPIQILENITTLRIHLDETNSRNGALKVIPGSHLNKICRLDSFNLSTEKEVTCEVGLGGIMVMKPLIIHGSNRTRNGKRRRVIHLELSNIELPKNLNWSERLNIN